MSLNKTEKAAIQNLLSRFRQQDYGCHHGTAFAPSYLEQAHAEGQEVVSRIYLDTWIVPALEALIKGNAKLARGLTSP